MDRLRASGKTMLLIAVAVLVAAGTVAVASIPDSSGVITACWDHTTGASYGALRVIDPSLAGGTRSANEYSCGSNENQITWNQQGPTGPVGPTGPSGTSGPAGPAGPRGFAASSSLLSFSSRGSFIFLKLEGIKGESTDAKHKDQIDVRGLSFGPGGGGKSAKSKIGEIVIVKHFDKSSPKLTFAVATGKPIPKATISLAKKKGGTKVDYLKFNLENVVVTSIKSTNSSSPKSDERVTLSFTELSEEFTGGVKTTINLTPKSP